MTKTRHSNTKLSSHESELITDPTRIARLLEQLATRNSPLAVRMPGHQTLYTSCTVGVEKPYVLLDELMPATGQQLLLKARALRVSCKLDGVDIRFSLSLQRVDEQKNLLTNYMNLPTELDYRQRRQDYRVHIPMSNQLQVIIDNVTDTENNLVVSKGLLHDLSHGGAGILLPPAAATISIEPGLICECALELPEAGRLYCSLELRYTKNFGTQNQQFIGARFMNLAPAQTRHIGRCISELEREFIRKRAAY